MTGILAGLLKNQRWFGAKSRTISEVKIVDSGELPGTGSLLTLISVSYTDGPPHLYFVPMLGTADAVTDAATCSALLSLIENELRVPMQQGFIQGRRSTGLTRSEVSLTPRLIKSEQSNSSIVFGDLLIMKLFRRQQPGENPDCEISRYLTEHTKFRRIPAFAGSIEYHDGAGEVYTLAMLQGLVPNEGDGWQWTLEQLAARKGADSSHGSTFQAAAILGRRTAEMHAALATFAPEALTNADVRQLAADMTERATATIVRLDQALPNQHALSTYARLRDLNPGSLRIRIPGD
jgi:maltose alpha-D-glucosyltransferase/alpha-amylase